MTFNVITGYTAAPPHFLKDGSPHCSDEELRPGKAFQEIPRPPPAWIGAVRTHSGPPSLCTSEQLVPEVFNKQTRQGSAQLPLTRQSLESNLLLMCPGRLGAGFVMARLNHLPPARGWREEARASEERPGRV